MRESWTERKRTWPVFGQTRFASWICESRDGYLTLQTFSLCMRGKWGSQTSLWDFNDSIFAKSLSPGLALLAVKKCYLLFIWRRALEAMAIKRRKLFKALSGSFTFLVSLSTAPLIGWNRTLSTHRRSPCLVLAKCGHVLRVLPLPLRRTWNYGRCQCCARGGGGPWGSAHPLSFRSPLLLPGPWPPFLSAFPLLGREWSLLSAPHLCSWTWHLHKPG